MQSRTTSKKTLVALALLLYLLALMALLSGCKPRKSLVEHRSDSLAVRTDSGVQLRDTLLRVPPAHVQASLPLPKPGMDLPPTTARSNRAWSTVQITNGILRHSGGCDSLALAATLYDRWQRTQKASTKVLTRYETKVVTVTPKWAWWALAIASFLVLLRLWPLLRRFINPLP